MPWLYKRKNVQYNLDRVDGIHCQHNGDTQNRKLRFGNVQIGRETAGAVDYKEEKDSIH